MCHRPSWLSLSLIGWALAAGNITSHTAWSWLSRGHPGPELRRLGDKAQTYHRESVTLLTASLLLKPGGGDFREEAGVSATVVLEEEETQVEKKDVSISVERPREVFLTKASFLHIKKQNQEVWRKQDFYFLPLISL